MKNLAPIKVIVSGNYSNTETKQEYIFIENVNELYHVYSIKGKRKKIQVPNHYLFDTSRSLHINKNIYIGTTDEIQGGFIPSNSLTNYLKKKVYKRREHAESFLIQQNFVRLRQTCFGYLACQQFNFTLNYIEGLSALEIAKKLQQAWGNNRGDFKSYLKIAKKYKTAGVTQYQGQNGYISRTENIYS